VYNSWAECKAAVTGFPKAEFRSFPTYEEASRFAFGGSALRAFHSSSTSAAAAAQSTFGAPVFPEEEKKVEVDMSARATTTFAVGKTPVKPGMEKSCIVYFDGGSRGNPGHAG
jgi:viroplasmin and RNaseH domain-containing protein